MSFRLTDPAPISPGDDFGSWEPFRVANPTKRTAWLQKICQGSVPISLGSVGGGVLPASLWSVDQERSRLHFSADASADSAGLVGDLVVQPYVWATAYLQESKIQFMVEQLGSVNRRGRLMLEGEGPREMYVMSRRSSPRVRNRHSGVIFARLQLAARTVQPDRPLQVLNLSLGGCGLLLPVNAPLLRPGQLLRQVEFELDELTFLFADLIVQNIAPQPGSTGELRVGCAWMHLPSGAQATLTQWLERAERHRQVITLQFD